MLVNSKNLYSLFYGVVLTLGAIGCGSNGKVHPQPSHTIGSRKVITVSSGVKNSKNYLTTENEQELTKRKDKLISVSYCATCQDSALADNSFPWPSNLINRNRKHEMAIYECPKQSFAEELAEVDWSTPIGQIEISKESVKCLSELTPFIPLHHVVVKVWASDFADTISILKQLPTDIEGLVFHLLDYDNEDVDDSVLGEVLKKFGTLKYLKLDSYSWNIVSSIQHLVTLEELELTVYDGDPKSDVSYNLSQQFLNGIQRLSITGHPELVTKFPNLKMLKTDGRIELLDLVSLNDLEYLIFAGEMPAKKLQVDAWPHLKSFIIGNHIIPTDEQNRFKRYHADAMIVFNTQDIVEQIFRKAKSIVMVNTISKVKRSFSTDSEIDLFLDGFAISTDYPHVHYPGKNGGLGALRCSGSVEMVVETYAGQRELFSVGGCGNNIKWTNHEDLSFRGTKETELCQWLAGLSMWEGVCRSEEGSGHDSWK